jgi:hypothetical protein
MEFEKKTSIIDSIRGEFEKEKKEVKKEEVKTEKTQVETNEIEVSAKTLRNRARRKKKKEKIIENPESKIVGIEKFLKPKTTEILLFKEKFCESETNREFLTLLDSANNSNDIAYTEEDFLEARSKHETARAIILDPSVDDIALGIGYKWFLVRPLYVNEYMDFVKEHGPRETKPKEFLEFCFEKCFLLPKMTNEQKSEVPSGTMLTLYRTILDISDFNKKYRIIEV